MRRARRNLPAVLAFGLLAFQVVIPWTVPHFVTQDGPSHVYTATVAKTLLFDRHSVYRPIYRFNHRIVPNWGSTLVVAAVASVVGAGHAEQALMSLALCAGFFAFSYALKILAPGVSPWTPVTNFLLQTWFLWMGFYNFYLGMVLCPLVIGFYIRHIYQLTVKRTVAIAFGLAALFLTHLIPAAMTALALGVTALWVHLVVPLVSRSRPAARHLGLVLLALLPTAALFVFFAASSTEPFRFQPAVEEAWNTFPLPVFTTGAGRSGTQTFLWPVVLGYIAVTAIAMRREWRTARGGLVIAAALTFLIYLFIPEEGLGGTQSKIRFAWGVFILGGLIASSARRLLPLRIPIAIYVSAFLIGTLVSTTQALSATNRAVEDYLAAVGSIPEGSRLIRIQYPLPGLPERYGFAAIGRFPLFHLDAYIAARCRCVDLTDYQAPNKIFPIDFKPVMKDALRYNLWALEMQQPGNQAAKVVPWLRENLPVPIDYVILIADESATADPGFSQVLANLDSGMRLITTSHPSRFVRVYQRTGSR